MKIVREHIEQFTRGEKNPFKVLNIGINNTVENIFNNIFDDKFIWLKRSYGDKNLKNIIKFLLQKGFNEKVIIYFFKSYHTEWIYSRYNKYSYSVFKKYYIKNYNNLIQDLIYHSNV